VHFIKRKSYDIFVALQYNSAAKMVFNHAERPDLMEGIVLRVSYVISAAIYRNSRSCVIFFRYIKLYVGVRRFGISEPVNVYQNPKAQIMAVYSICF
jgi:hypothetical protein